MHARGGGGAAHWKFAVTVCGPEMVRVCGFAEPVKAPVQLMKAQPEAGVAVSCTTVPLLKEPPADDGFVAMLPLAAGDTPVVSGYWATVAVAYWKLGGT